MAAQSPMIACPLKRTDEVDWITPLKRYIAVSYQDDPSKYAEETSTIHRLRQDMRGAGMDTTGRDVLYRYFGQLEMLDLRFPVDEAHIKISFQWYDAFTQKPTAQYSLAFEKASTIFNIASVLTAIAVAHNRVNEPEGVKKAFHFFQAAAGVYTYINENFLHAPSIDLSRDTVKMLVSLMLAQAQEVFYEKTVAEKKKPLLISKLAGQVAWGYQNTLEAMADGVTKGVFERNWQSLCQIKAKLFTAIAHYNRSLAAEAESKWGEMVGRAQVAEIHAKEAEKLAKTLVSGFVAGSHPVVTFSKENATTLYDITKSHLSIISEKKTHAVRDNDLIYHEAVPTEGTLPALEKLNATKPQPITDLYPPAEMQKIIGADIFQRLVPLSVHESSSLYSEEKAKVVRGEVEKCDTANQELASALEFMDLPGGLQKFKEGSGGGDQTSLDALAVPPTPVKECADLIQAEEGGGESIANLIDRIDKAKARSKDALENASLALDEERSQCEAMRVKYGDLWTQPPSGPHTQHFRTDIKSLTESIDKAAMSDHELHRSFDTIANHVLILRQGRDSPTLESLFAKIVVDASKSRKGSSQSGASLLDVEDVDGGKQAIPKMVAKVEDVLARLNKIKKERMDTLEDLKAKTRQDDISNLLILNKKIANIEPQLFASELEKYRPYQTRITATINHQQTLMQELAGHFKELMNGQEARNVHEVWEAAEKRRQALGDQMIKTKATYSSVKDGYRQGIRYYDELDVRVQDLLNAVNQFCSSRKDERQMLEGQVLAQRTEQESKALKDQLNRLGAGSSTSASSSNNTTLPIDAMANLNLGSAPQFQSSAPVLSSALSFSTVPSSWSSPAVAPQQPAHAPMFAPQAPAASAPVTPAIPMSPAAPLAPPAPTVAPSGGSFMIPNSGVFALPSSVPSPASAPAPASNQTLGYGATSQMQPQQPYYQQQQPQAQVQAQPQAQAPNYQQPQQQQFQANTQYQPQPLYQPQYQSSPAVPQQQPLYQSPVAPPQNGYQSTVSGTQYQQYPQSQQQVQPMTPTHTHQATYQAFPSYTSPAPVQQGLPQQQPMQAQPYQATYQSPTTQAYQSQYQPVAQQQQQQQPYGQAQTGYQQQPAYQQQGYQQQQQPQPQPVQGYQQPQYGVQQVGQPYGQQPPQQQQPLQQQQQQYQQPQPYMQQQQQPYRQNSLMD
ncbi:bck1-like resistance to osmotic shock [Actinomortierella ambigua]|nr:bck1-like resistance to osmotic shock [Actinomortierella ambigua]